MLLHGLGMRLSNRTNTQSTRPSHLQVNTEVDTFNLSHKITSEKQETGHC